MRRLQEQTEPCGWLLVLAGALGICTLALRAQPVPFGRIRNFSVPEYYAPPNQNQVKSLISGAEAEPQPESRFLIKELKAETFRENGEPSIVISAPECIYDSPKREASSAGRLQMQSSDDRLFLEGEGFLWRQDDSTLIISNRGHTMIRQQPRKLEQAEKMNKTVTALALGTGLVLAAQAQTDVPSLTNAAAPGYTNVPGTPNAARLQAGDTEIFSDVTELDWKARLAVFQGKVRVEKPGMRMTCELLTSNLPERGGRVTNVVAKQEVVFDARDEAGQKIRGTGERAVYTYEATATETNELVELTGNPVLETTQGTLTADVVTYDLRTGKLKATNQKMVVRMEPAGATNEVASTNVPAHAPLAESKDTTTNSVSEPAPANPQPPQ